jgi:hypothetical protein
MPVHRGEMWSFAVGLLKTGADVSVSTARSDKPKIGLSAPEAMHTASQRRNQVAAGSH